MNSVPDARRIHHGRRLTLLNARGTPTGSLVIYPRLCVLNAFDPFQTDSAPRPTVFGQVDASKRALTETARGWGQGRRGDRFRARI